MLSVADSGPIIQKHRQSQIVRKREVRTEQTGDGGRAWTDKELPNRYRWHGQAVDINNKTSNQANMSIQEIKGKLRLPQ